MADSPQDNLENQQPFSTPRPDDEPTARLDDSESQDPPRTEVENEQPSTNGAEDEPPPSAPPEPQNLSDEEVFARFWTFLSADAEEAGRHYIRLHKKLVGFFTLKGIADPAQAADETIDRAARKIIAGTPVPDVDKYCLGIARHIYQERLRREKRDLAAFRKFIADLDDGKAEQIERIYRVLKPCYEELTDEERELLAAYCEVLRGRARAEHRQQLAEKMQTTVLALRMRVTRLRRNLADCVKKRSQDG
jgi:hypothetical protein